VRLGKTALLLQSRYAHARQYKRAGREKRKLKTQLGCVYRDVLRKLPEDASADLRASLALADRLLKQERHDTNKLYSIHEPDVECIAKGKAHKKYEFGCKASLVTTSVGNWAVGALAFHGNPYDGHTLTPALEQVERLLGTAPKQAYCDRGYRGHGHQGETEVHIVDHKRKRLTRAEKKWRKRRAAIEPVIGHLKEDHRLSRNLLKGKDGDKLNVLLAACGWNLRKLLRVLLCLVRKWLNSRIGLENGGGLLTPGPCLEAA
jgi:IS5 family transposase